MSNPEISRRCQACGASVRATAQFCPQCGLAMMKSIVTVHSVPDSVKMHRDAKANHEEEQGEPALPRSRRAKGLLRLMAQQPLPTCRLRLTLHGRKLRPTTDKRRAKRAYSPKGQRADLTESPGGYIKLCLKTVVCCRVWRNCVKLPLVCWMKPQMIRACGSCLLPWRCLAAFC